ncbi:MAG: cell division protein FtsZ [Verrucomicrobia bacterium]|nr:cell division protein FtsZ [Verrucomicrobiota bacterium]
MQTELPQSEPAGLQALTTPASAAAGAVKKALTLKVIGVGGAGGNAVSHMARTPIDGVDCVVINTDAAALERCAVAHKLNLGAKLTRGLGAGGDPERGRAAAEEDREHLKALCQGVDVLFVVAGLGGGTGTGASPVLAQLGREAGALVLGMVVLPFDWEGSRRQRQAQLGLHQLKAVADAVICLPNQKLFTLVADKTSVVEGFAVVHDLLAQGVRGVWRLLTRPGLINVDFADVCTVTRDRHSECALATAEAQGEHRVKEVLEKLLKHPLMEGGQTLGEAGTVLVSLAGGPDIAFSDVNGVMEQINRHCENAHIITGAAIEEGHTGRLAVTVLATRRSGKDKAAAATTAVEALLPEPPFVDPSVEHRPPSRYVAPPPVITPDNVDQFMPNAPARMKKRVQKMQQGQLNLEIISKGRFEKSEPTIRRGQDLDVPTYLRRNLVLN